MVTNSGSYYLGLYCSHNAIYVLKSMVHTTRFTGGTVQLASKLPANKNTNTLLMAEEFSLQLMHLDGQNNNDDLATM